MWLIPLIAALATTAPTVSLPGAIRSTLDQEYPGWKLAPVTKQVQQEFAKHHLTQPPSLVSADFDRDGKQDYAIQIVLTTPGQEEQIIIIFLARGGGYEENIVQSMGIDPTVYLWIPPKKNVLMVLGGPLGETVYGYQDGRFQEVSSPEDPDHPDLSIPKPPEAL